MLSLIQRSTGCSSCLCNNIILIKFKQSESYFSVSSARCSIGCPSLERGLDFLRDPRLNKGLAFTIQERQALGILGLLAGNYKTQEEQVEICKLSIDRFKDPLNQYLYLSELHDTNERLFYTLISTDVEKYLPIVYTPTVGTACQKFGIAYRKPRGLFITIKDRCHIYDVLRNWPVDDVRAICVTDGERILGLGDLGAYGMGIPIGKLCLYTALAGVQPHQTLPITLDVGTNNEKLLVDPLYIGIRRKRATGHEYDDFMDEFMEACVQRYGRRVLIQFEDFALGNARRLLKKYQPCYCTFNDDIQGTAAVAVAGVLSAARITKKKVSENVFFFLGAGSAGVGIADLLVDAMIEEGLKREAAESKIYLFDVDGLLSNKRPNGVPDHAKHFGKDLEPTKDFKKAIAEFKATCLVGVSTVGGAFTPEILQQLAKNCETPIIFALSNPTTKAECTAQQAYDNTEGRCLYSSGSPFPPVKYKNKTYYTGQGNNSYIFPGVALGIIAGNISLVSDKMFLTAAKTLATICSDKDTSVGRVYPPLTDTKKISFQIAESVIEQAFTENLAGVFPKPTDMKAFIEPHIYDLCYPCHAPEFYDYCTANDYKPKTVKEYHADQKLKERMKLPCKESQSKENCHVMSGYKFIDLKVKM